MTLSVGSLFSGIGAFDLGFQRAGATITWQCEIDPHARAVLARHFPGVHCYEDVREVGVNAAAVDVICGGFPCQDVSVAGRRAGLAGERSGLWFEFHRILRELRPRFVVIENVPGLLSSHKGRDFAVILQGLVELGYRVCWRILDAQYFGLAQQRRRVFVVGSLGDGRAAEVLLEPESEEGDTSPRQAEQLRSSEEVGEDPRRIAPTLYASMDSKWGSNQWVRSEMGVVDSRGIRRYTPTEVERLMGFADGYTNNQADKHRYHQLGNAIGVPVAEWLAKRIVAVS